MHQVCTGTRYLVHPRTYPEVRSIPNEHGCKKLGVVTGKGIIHIVQHSSVFKDVPIINNAHSILPQEWMGLTVS